MKSLRFVVPGVVLLVALGLLADALWYTDRRTSGSIGLVLLTLGLAGLAFVTLRQRQRLRHTKEDLARTRMRAEAAVEASPDGIVILTGRRIVSANPAFRRLLAVPPDAELAGEDIAAFFVESDRERASAWISSRLQGAVEPDRFDAQGQARGGSAIPLEIAAALLPAEGRPQLALFLRDLSARRTLEQRTRDSDRVEALTDIAETVAGEFHKVLTQIRSHAREAPSQDADAAQTRLLSIERLASRGLALVRRVRSFAPNTSDVSARRPLDLARLAREVCGDFLRGLPQGLSLRFSAEGPDRLIVSAEAAPLRHALWQLLENARDAQGQGEIVVRTRAAELDEARAEQHPGSHPGAFAVVEVRDTGAGMSEDVRLRAFEPFFSTKGGRATGLGLTAAYGTVRALGGYAELDSELGRGTLVRLALPRLPESALPEQSVSEEPDPRARWRGREHVLVVDDDTSGRDLAREILERFGYHVEVATTPREALDRLRHKPAVDLVLLDMVLPGWSGLEVLRRIVRIWPGLRVLMVSPYPLPDQEASALQIGAADTVRKPLADPDLARAIREALDRPPPPGAA